ncbi:unnamed protein product, partial [Polarella glacialis]
MSGRPASESPEVFRRSKRRKRIVESESEAEEPLTGNLQPPEPDQKPCTAGDPAEAQSNVPGADDAGQADAPLPGSTTRREGGRASAPARSSVVSQQPQKVLAAARAWLRSKKADEVMAARLGASTGLSKVEEQRFVDANKDRTPGVWSFEVLDERIQARSREAPSASTVAGPKPSPVLEEAASSIEAFAAEASAVEASARAASFWAEAPLVLQVAAVAPSPAEPAPAEVPAFEEQQQHQQQEQQEQQQQQEHHQKPQQQQQQPQQQEQQQQQEQHHQQEQQPQATSLAQRRQGRGSGRGLRSSSNEVPAGATRRQVPSGLILRDSAGRRRFAPQRPSVLQGGRLRASE